MENEQQHVRIHVTVPGPRAGIPYGISIETIDCMGYTDAEMEAEVTAAMMAYDKTKAELEERLNRNLEQQLRESVNAVENQKKVQA